jgi:hypothetical protein
MEAVMERLEGLRGRKAGGNGEVKNSPEPESEEEKPVQPMTMQASFTDFGLYLCAACGKRVIGFEKERHAREVHGGKKLEWVKVK